MARDELAPLWIRTLPVVGDLFRLFRGDRARELSYHITVERLFAERNLGMTARPFKGAANASLLYLIMEVVDRLEIRSVLELGAGQSTLLLDKLRSKRPELLIKTLESDASWASHIGSIVEHEVIYAPLLIDHEQPRISRYDTSLLKALRFDLIVIDGPVGLGRFSRMGAADIVEEFASDEFVVVFDDAERRWELAVVRETIKKLAASDRPVAVGITSAASCQVLLASPAFEHLRFL